MAVMAILPIVERAARVGMSLGGVKKRKRATAAGEVCFFDARGSGSLPPMAIIHGIGSSATPYGPMILRLRREARRVIAPDAPGHGDSGRPEGAFTLEDLFTGISEVLAAELSEPALLFGNSLGGGVALRYALERPERVRGLVLSSPGGAQVSEDALASLLETFRHKDAAESRAFLERLYANAPWYTRFLGADLHRLFSRGALHELLASIRAEHLFREEDVRQLRVPVLLLWGTADRILPREHLAFWRRALPPHAVIEEPEGFSHCPYLEEGDALAERLVRFARSLG